MLQTPDPSPTKRAATVVTETIRCLSTYRNPQTSLLPLLRTEI